MTERLVVSGKTEGLLSYYTLVRVLLSHGSHRYGESMGEIDGISFLSFLLLSLVCVHVISTADAVRCCISWLRWSSNRGCIMMMI